MKRQPHSSKLQGSSNFQAPGASLSLFGVWRLVIISYLVFGNWCFAAPAARPPNILVLLADDLGYAELGCQGSRDIPTPHIDSLARNGVRFTSGYVTAPFCSPSRAGLLTGRYQTRFGFEFNPVGKANLDPASGLPLTERTLADHLKSAGYSTALVGKWHLGGTTPFHPQQRGFDTFFGFLHEGHFFVPPPYSAATSFLRTNTLPAGAERRTNGPVIWGTHLKNNEPPYDADNPILRGIEPINEPAYLTDALTREALAVIAQNKSRPWMLYLPYNAVHSPMQATPKYLDRFRHIPDIQRRIFAAMLAALDNSVGAILAKLRELNLEENTLIFFLSDNGGPTKELTSSNAPLRGGKGQLFEGGIRVPFLMQWKGKIPAGITYEHPVSSIDILPTALAAAGRPVKAPLKTDGKNLLPHLTGKDNNPPHEVLFWRYGRNIAVRVGDWKLVRQAQGAGNALELFNLSTDIAETFDQSRREPQITARLKAELDRLNSEMMEPLWSSNPGKK